MSVSCTKQPRPRSMLVSTPLLKMDLRFNLKCRWAHKHNIQNIPLPDLTPSPLSSSEHKANHGYYHHYPDQLLQILIHPAFQERVVTEREWDKIDDTKIQNGCNCRRDKEEATLLPAFVWGCLSTRNLVWTGQELLGDQSRTAWTIRYGYFILKTFRKQLLFKSSEDHIRSCL